jgi:hypothetical protein
MLARTHPMAKAGMKARCLLVERIEMNGRPASEKPPLAARPFARLLRVLRKRRARVVTARSRD